MLDTNVLVSGLAYPAGPPGRIVRAWRQGELVLVLSEHILEELERVLPRLNRRLGWSKTDFADFIDTLALQVEMVVPAKLSADTARDAADVPVLGTLLESGADCLITGDGDLLALAAKYPIVTPAEFWRKHGF